MTSRLLLYALLLTLQSHSQTYYTNIKTFGEADAFNITEGGTLSQDTKGFIWIASRNGLYRFNGTSFKHYVHIASDSFSLPGNQVNFCFQDKDGDYWTGISAKGLYRFDDKTEKFTPYKNKNSREIDMSQLYNVNAPFQDSHGRLWMSVATIGIVRIDKKENTAKLFSVCDQYDPVDLYRSCRWVNGFAEDSKGWFWLNSNHGMIHFNPASGNYKSYSSPVREATCYFQDSEGQQWVGTWGTGLRKMDTTASEWKPYKWSNDALGTTNIVSGIAEKDRDHLWVSSRDAGLMLFNKRTGSFIPVSSQDRNESIFKSIYSIFKDRQENIWIEGGEQLGRINGHNLLRYEYTGNAALENPKTTSCFFHLPGDSLVFIGSIYSPEGLQVYNLNTRNIRALKLHLPGATENIADIFAGSKKQLWIATNYGVYLLDRKTLQARPFAFPSKKYEALLRSSIVKIAEDKTHRMWFASRWYGLLCFDPQTATTVHYSSDSSGKYHLPVDQIEYASFDSKGNLWVGTHAYLSTQPPVFCLKPDGSVTSYDKHIPLNSVFQVEAGKDKIIAATASAGLFEIHSPLQSTETVRRFSEDDGVADSYIEGFAEDKKGNLWIATHNGLSCKMANGEFLSFHTKDGLAYNKIEGRPYIDDKGLLFLPFVNGFQFFDTDSLLSHSSSVGPVILESLAINQEQYSGNPNYLRKLDLRYNENNLSFEFAAFDLSQGDRLQYAYKLEGSDTKWNEIGASRRLFFSNLSPGKYKLKLRAGDRFNNWSRQELILPVIIHPPFWKTWWFYTLCLVATALLVYFIYHIRLSTVLAEQRLRNKIARDLHDDIGSTLSGIKLFSSMAQTRLAEERSGAINIIERIGERSEKMIDAMSDIVWSINPANDTIENMLVRMKQYAAEMMEPKNLGYHFSVDEKVAKTKIGLETRKDIYLIFKESINNAVKHSNCKNIEVQMNIRRKHLILTVADDGVGFDVTLLNGSGNGLRNFRERAKTIGATVSIISQREKGTTIQLNVPVT